MKSMINWISFFILLFFSSQVFAKCIDDVSTVDKSILRNQNFLDVNNPGIRLAWNNLKEKNKKYQELVDPVREAYECKLSEYFKSEQFKTESKVTSVTITKTDFKGYYIDCDPKPGCFNAVMSALDPVNPKVPFPVFNGPESEILERTFTLTPAQASSYKEGYVKARAIATYGEDFKEPLHEFINDQMNRAIAATGVDLNNMNSNEFMLNLEKNIELARAGYEPEEKYKSLIEGLDSLLETPFDDSNDLENSLKGALEKGNGQVVGDYVISSAESGDDLFIIIKDKDGNVIKVIGADAKGLGVLNMTTRLKRLIGSDANGGGVAFSSLQDVLDLSHDAMTDANIDMSKSMNTYKRLYIEAFANVGDKSIDEVLQEVHDKYYQMSIHDPNMMQMRSTAIPDCTPKNACIRETVTILHNMTKMLEAQGVQGLFGSCLGIEYWRRKKNITFPDKW